MKILVYFSHVAWRIKSRNRSLFSYWLWCRDISWIIWYYFYITSISKTTRLVLIVTYYFLRYTDEEPLPKEIEENQHPIAYAPVKFKQYMKQEPEDEEQSDESNVTEDLTREASQLIHVSVLLFQFLIFYT